MRKTTILLLSFAVFLVISAACHGAQVVLSQKVDEAPVIDGSGSDTVWVKAPEITTHDEAAGIDMTLKTVHTDTGIFFLVTFPDADESRTHKTWIWDKAKERYITGPDREDTFVFKWNMEPYPVDLSLKSNNDYMADIWFWKARRTDPAGYADDKYQQFSGTEIAESYNLLSEGGMTRYLLRKGDSGSAAYKDTLYADYEGEKMPRYTNNAPTGSRADVTAKGVWSGGKWTIEFGRALDTGNMDDIRLDASSTYLFGVSRYEIAGRPPDPNTEQPFYGSGDVSERLTLQFEK